MRIEQEIQTLKAERDAVILAHNYQPGEIQDIADFTGDSLELAREATHIRARVVVFCGVHFMAETAAILNPDKTVLLPAADAGCPMADMITGEQLRAMKARHPDARVLCYVNSTAEVKAESDCCVTSAMPWQWPGVSRRNNRCFSCRTAISARTRRSRPDTTLSCGRVSVRRTRG